MYFSRSIIPYMRGKDYRESIGIDTPEDLTKALEALKGME